MIMVIHRHYNKVPSKYDRFDTHKIKVSWDYRIESNGSLIADSFHAEGEYILCTEGNRTEP